MCLAMTVEYACSRCKGTMMKDAYQVPRTACAEAAAKGPGFFGACQRGVERRTQRQRCLDDDDDDSSERSGEEQLAGYQRYLLPRGERLCAGCEIDDEIRGLDADSALLDPPGVVAPSSASSTATETGEEEEEENFDDLEILPFWIVRATRRQAHLRVFETPLTLRGGGSGSEGDDDSSDDDEDGGTSLDQDSDDDDEDGGAKL